MASGVKVDDDVKSTFQSISLTSKQSTKLKYAIFTFSSDCKKIVVERSGAQGSENSDYESVISSLPPNDVRYVAYDFDFKNKDNTVTSKMVFISWHPETSPIKKKMLVASSLNALKMALGISQNIIEGDTISEINTQAALEKVGGNEAL